MKMRCPHCKSPATVRTSHEITTLSREIHFACGNTDCGHTFVAVAEIHRTLSPSAIPDPQVRLPLSSHIRRPVLLEQLHTLPRADALRAPAPPPAAGPPKHCTDPAP